MSQDTSETLICSDPSFNTFVFKEEQSSPSDIQVEMKKQQTSEKTFNYQCQICNMAFRKSLQLTKHNQRHKYKDRFKCSQCQLGFMFGSNLQKHMNEVHCENRPFDCKFCDKNFKRISNLDRHLRSCHSDDRPYVCNICQKTYKFSNGLAHHHRYVHERRRPFSCEVCGKQCGLKSELMIHLRIHTNEKPFVCDVCQKAFRERRFLTNHFLRHTSKKTVACPDCPKRFYSRLDLNFHKKNHMTRFYYKCNTCKYSYCRVKTPKQCLLAQSKEEKPICSTCNVEFVVTVTYEKNRKCNREEVEKLNRFTSSKACPKLDKISAVDEKSQIVSDSQNVGISSQDHNDSDNNNVHTLIIGDKLIYIIPINNSLPVAVNNSSPTEELNLNILSGEDSNK